MNSCSTLRTAEGKIVAGNPIPGTKMIYEKEHFMTSQFELMINSDSSRGENLGVLVEDPSIRTVKRTGDCGFSLAFKTFQVQQTSVHNGLQNLGPSSRR